MSRGDSNRNNKGRLKWIVKITGILTCKKGEGIIVIFWVRHPLCCSRGQRRMTVIKTDVTLIRKSCVVTRVSCEEHGPLPKTKCPVSLCSKGKAKWTSNRDAILDRMDLTEDLWSPFQKFDSKNYQKWEVTEAEGDRGSTPSYCHKK